MNLVARDVCLTYSDHRGDKLQPKFKLAVPHFVAEEGDMVFVVGKSGTGKTTLLRAIAGLHACEAGSFRFDPVDSIVRLLPQAPQILPWRRVSSNLKLPAEVLRREFDEGHAENSLKALGLSEIANTRPNELSGGMYARVALAQLLVDRPDLLLLDEPTAALDEDSRELCFEVIGAHLRAKGAVAVVATHDLASTSKWASKLYCVHESPDSSSLMAIDLSELKWGSAGPDERANRLRTHLSSLRQSSEDPL